MKKEALLPKLKRMIRSHIELKLIFFAVLTLFLFFLAAPIAMLLPTITYGFALIYTFGK